MSDKSVTRWGKTFSAEADRCQVWLDAISIEAAIDNPSAAYQYFQVARAAMVAGKPYSRKLLTEYMAEKGLPFKRQVAA